MKLNRSNSGYQIYGTESKVNHLPNMDDLKLIGISEEELTNEIKIVKTISIDMKRNLNWRNVPKFV
jgi:hypothetical protein